MWFLRTLTKYFVVVGPERELEMKDFSSFPIVIDQSDHETNTSWQY